MSLRPQDTDTRVIITVEEIDHSTVDTFDAELRRALDQYADAPHSRPDRSAGSLVVDLRNVSFMSSAGIRALIQADQDAMAHGGRLVVDGAQGVVLRCLEVTGLLDHLQVSDGSEEPA
jgi:anti-anti-sigma factor